MKNMRFVSKKDKLPQADPPSLVNWRRNLLAFPRLWNIFKSKGFRHIKSGFINQDPVENFFGNLRSNGCRNVTPTCFQTEGSFKALLISNLTSIHSIGSNCTNDEATPLASLNKYSR